jgi:hypothetical protein
MATPLVFTKVTTWVDLTDPANIPPGAKLIGAADLLRYENGIDQLVTRVNSHDTSIVTLQSNRTTDSGNITTLQNQRVTDSGNITALQSAVGTNTTAIANLQNGVLVASTAQTLTATKATNFYIHTGAAVTSTMPNVAGNTGKVMWVKNRGTAALTLNFETNKLWNTAGLASSLAFAVGSQCGFVNDGTFWVRFA